MSTLIAVHGRLTRSPELKFSNNGTAIVNISIAVNERVKDKDTGQFRDGDASFFTAIGFGQMAEMVAETLDKGDLILATGVMKMRTWETKEGDKRTAFEITLDDIGKSLKWLEKKNGSRPQGANAGYDETPPF